MGVGSLELQLRALMEELRQAGYFDEQRKKPLPLLSRRVAVVTSRSGAALQDVINTAQHRWPGCQLYLYDVLVQGAQAAPHIASAIEILSRDGPAMGIDAIILTRGGGSMEDLWAFNERIVADAVYRCRLPIVAAIGHEIDTTVAELVADVRASTPTQAVMRLLPDHAALSQQLTQQQRRLLSMIQRNLHQQQQRLESFARHVLFRKPQNVLQPLLHRLQELHRQLRSLPPQQLQLAKHDLENRTQRLRNTLPVAVLQRKQQLESLSRQLQSLAPQRVLERGYTYTFMHDGKLLRQPDQVQPGDSLPPCWPPAVYAARSRVTRCRSLSL
ncbi:MAG: exodeoxyribonuclease VII large subunit [Phycisphaerales bacterium]|nr:exodeoxyribonuclease VII large subunit [Phycisphaerales bacterium]